MGKALCKYVKNPFKVNTKNVWIPYLFTTQPTKAYKWIASKNINVKHAKKKKWIAADNSLHISGWFSYKPFGSKHRCAKSRDSSILKWIVLEVFQTLVMANISMVDIRQIIIIVDPPRDISNTAVWK